ncbi:hypothetical protein D3C78_1807530 [compost metagenome]
MICCHSSRARTLRYTHSPSSRWKLSGKASDAGATAWVSCQSPSASTACMKASDTPTDMLKLARSPPSLAWMKASMSGWLTSSTPICAPRRAPADSTV